MDTPQPRPRELGETPPPAATGPVAMDPAKVAECGRGTGRDAEGTCRQLGALDAGYVQRIQIPGGVFVMGNIPDGYDAARAREQPAVHDSGQPPRLQRLPSFWIDLHEVTRGAYEACEAAGECTAARCGDGAAPGGEYSAAVGARMPQTCVTHEQARAFCSARGAALPTEAQWEYAARGVDARIFPWGNEVKDDLEFKIGPVGWQRIDRSYFGILGLGANAIEWVADEYDPDAGLRPFLSGEFRDANGPVLDGQRRFELGVACGTPAAAGCTAAAAPRRVVKSGRSGARRAMRAVMPAHPVAAEREGWPMTDRSPDVGFRCVAALDPGRDVALTAPADPPEVPLLRRVGGLELFGGVAEAVSQREARAFCKRLRVSDGGRERADFRLPTLPEVRAIAVDFRGPGPFWIADGAAISSGEGGSWDPVEAKPDQALLARCVRDAS